MDAWEVLYSIRMLLDDSRDWYFANVLWAIDRAQEKVIRRLYAEHNELALRPLYVMDQNIMPGNVIREIDINTGMVNLVGRVMFPRYCEFYLVNPNNPNIPLLNTGITAKYVPPDKYFRLQFNYIFQPFNPLRNPLQVRAMPRLAYYTVVKNAQNNPETSSLLYPFDPMAANYRARFYYIRYPRNFATGFDNNGNLINPVGLEIDSIYHPDVIGLAAEILNSQDVQEIQRGEIFNVYQGDTKLTLKDVLNTYLEDLKRR